MKRKRIPKAVERAQRGAAAYAATTRRRASGAHRDRKKQANKRACRKKVQWDE